MTLHTLDAAADTLHGSFDTTRPPVLTIESGDTVRYTTVDVSWGTGQFIDET